MKPAHRRQRSAYLPPCPRGMVSQPAAIITVGSMLTALMTALETLPDAVTRSLSDLVTARRNRGLDRDPLRRARRVGDVLPPERGIIGERRAGIVDRPVFGDQRHRPSVHAVGILPINALRKGEIAGNRVNQRAARIDDEAADPAIIGPNRRIAELLDERAESGAALSASEGVDLLAALAQHHVFLEAELREGAIVEDEHLAVGLQLRRVPAARHQRRKVVFLEEFVVVVGAPARDAEEQVGHDVTPHLVVMIAEARGPFRRCRREQ